MRSFVVEYWDVYNKKGKWKRRVIRKGERLKKVTITSLLKDGF